MVRSAWWLHTLIQIETSVSSAACSRPSGHPSSRSKLAASCKSNCIMFDVAMLRVRRWNLGGKHFQWFPVTKHTRELIKHRKNRQRPMVPVSFVKWMKGGLSPHLQDFSHKSQIPPSTQNSIYCTESHYHLFLLAVHFCLWWLHWLHGHKGRAI